MLWKEVFFWLNAFFQIQLCSRILDDKRDRKREVQNFCRYHWIWAIDFNLSTFWLLDTVEEGWSHRTNTSVFLKLDWSLEMKKNTNNEEYTIFWLQLPCKEFNPSSSVSYPPIKRKVAPNQHCIVVDPHRIQHFRSMRIRTGYSSGSGTGSGVFLTENYKIL